MSKKCADAKSVKEVTTSEVVQDEASVKRTSPAEEETDWVENENLTLSGSETMSKGKDLMVSQILAAVNVKLPYLLDIQKENIRRFLKSYEQYKMESRKVGIRPIQDFIKVEDAEVIQDFHDLSFDDYVELSEGEMRECLCALHAAYSDIEVYDRLKAITMKSDDASLGTLLQFNRDFNFELECCGKEFVLKKKRIARLYCFNLKPKLLSNLVSNSEPEDLAEAQRMARQALVRVKTFNDTAKYLKIDTNAKEKEDKDIKKKEFGVTNKKIVQPSKLDKSTIKCFKCNKMGHFANECTEKNIQGKKTQSLVNL